MREPMGPGQAFPPQTDWQRQVFTPTTCETAYKLNGL